MAITPLTSSDTFKTWFDTTNTIIGTVNGITGVNGGSITGPYVMTFNGLTGVVTFNNYVSLFNGATGSVTGMTGVGAGSGILITGTSTNPTITNSGVLSVNSATGVIDNIAVTNAPQIFTSLQQFTGGISASGATFSGNISAPNVLTTSAANVFTSIQTFNSGISASGATFNGNIRVYNGSFSSGISASGATFSGNISAPNIVNSFNGSTGAVTFTNYVSSFNGSTGSIQGVSSFNGATGAITFNQYVSSFNGLTGSVTGPALSTPNTFTALQEFTAGITTSTLYVTTLASLACPQTVIGGTTLSIYTDNIVIGNSTADIVTLSSGQVIRTLTTNTAGTSAISILEYPITSYSSAEFLIQGERYTTLGGTVGTQTVKILMSAICGSSTYTVSHVEYGNITTGSSVASYTVDTNGSSWRLRVTPTSSNTMRFRTIAFLYPNVGGVGSGA